MKRFLNDKYHHLISSGVIALATWLITGLHTLNAELYTPVPISLYENERDMWELQYLYHTLHYDGNRKHASHISNRHVLQEFDQVTTYRNVQRHEFTLGYRPDGEWGLSITVPYIHIHANIKQRVGRDFTMTSQGIGDTILSGTYLFYDVYEHQMWANLGLSFPTGSISQQRHTPQGYARLPYTMQLGSGTLDLLPSILYKARAEWWFWEASGGGTFRLSYNNKHYRLGTDLFIKGWAARQLTDWGATVCLGLLGNYWGNIKAHDEELNPHLIPDADPKLQSGIRFDLLPGFFIRIQKGPLKRMQFGTEAILPLFQYLRGPQNSLQWGANIYWEWLI